jgi:deoxyribodipyrimidine photo-lyase
MAPALVWFRNDLRTRDHEPLARADADADRVIPVYCLDPRHFGTTRWGLEKTGAHRARFLLESLADLRAGLRDLGGDLVVRRGRPEDVIPDLVRRTGATAVYAHEEPMSEERTVEHRLRDALGGTDARLRLWWGHTLYHPDDLPSGEDEVPDVFTPFRKRVEKSTEVRATLPAPESLDGLPDGLDAGELPTLADLGVEEPPDDDRAVLRFRGGESAGLGRLHAYLWEQDLLRTYKETRNGLLGADYSSKFSAWLAHGCLSPRTIYEEVEAYEHERVSNRSTYWLVFELVWRDFFRFIGRKYGDRLFYPSGPMVVEVDWAHDDEAFERWASGTTGVPFVDANMRELNRTGFMSNRGRQNVASFLAKNLSLDWRRGASYFESRLVDYDVTSNWGNWAYVAGVGNDPRDRYFNILSQAQRYDADGDYVKHWLPELARVPAGRAHAPHEMSRSEQEDYGAVIGDDYPAPMIDLDASYERIRGGR